MSFYADYLKFLMKNIFKFTIITLVLSALCILIPMRQAKEFVESYPQSYNIFGLFYPVVRAKNGVIEIDYLGIVGTLIISYYVPSMSAFLFSFYKKRVSNRRNSEDTDDLNSEYNTSFRDYENSLDNNYYEDK